MEQSHDEDDKYEKSCPNTHHMFPDGIHFAQTKFELDNYAQISYVNNLEPMI